jgi:hypothetical protein
VEKKGRRNSAKKLKRKARTNHCYYLWVPFLCFLFCVGVFVSLFFLCFLMLTFVCRDLISAGLKEMVVKQIMNYQLIAGVASLIYSKC